MIAQRFVRENPHPHVSPRDERCGIRSMVGCSGVFRLCLMNATQPLQSVADEELVRQLAMGLDEAVALLQQRYGSLLTSLASRRLDRPSAEEIVQDVFLTVWQHSPRFDPSRGSF